MAVSYPALYHFVVVNRLNALQNNACVCFPLESATDSLFTLCHVGAFSNILVFLGNYKMT